MLGNGESVDIIYLDFAKAFDKVSYLRFKKELRSHGIGGQISVLIKVGVVGKTGWLLVY